MLPTDLMNRFFCDVFCSSNSFLVTKSSDLFLNKKIRLNCARSRREASATVNIASEV